jgi:hypothetical protein
MGYHVSIEIPPELDEFIEKLAIPDAAVEAAALIPMKEASWFMEASWEAIAAIDTRRYVDSIESEVRSLSGVILQAFASTDVTSPAGFPYPRALEDSERYHYRKTARAGQRTAGQIARMFKAIRPRLEEYANRAIQNIFDWWSDD